MEKGKEVINIVTGDLIIRSRTRSRLRETESSKKCGCHRERSEAKKSVFNFEPGLLLFDDGKWL